VSKLCFYANDYSNIEVELSQTVRYDHNDFDRNFKQTINIQTTKLPNFPKMYDIILGLNTILKYNLLNFFRARFEREENNMRGEKLGLCKPEVSYAQLEIDSPSSNSHNVETQPVEELAANTAEAVQIVTDDADIPEKDAAVSWIDGQAEENKLNAIPTNMYGTIEFQNQLKELCTEYKDIFSRSLRREPARVPPMEIDMEPEKAIAWKTDAKNRLPPRLMSTVKEQEIRKQVEAMVQSAVVAPAEQAYYSQVLLTPKPDKSWRFCIGYRYIPSG